MTGWQAICRFLEDRGVSHVFGLPGTQNAELFSELGSTQITIVTCIHELSAGFAAIGHAIASGEPAVLLTIAGPGFCYATAPLVEARHDSVPLIHIVIKAPGHDGRQFELQDIDHSGIANRLAKACRYVDTSNELAKSLSWAWRTAASQEPGPVVLLIDSNVLDVEQSLSLQLASEVDADVKSVPDLIPDELIGVLTGKRVCVFAGGGASRAHNQLKSVVEKMNWPVMTTLSGRGVIPENHRLAVPVDQRDVNFVNEVVGSFDIVLAIGVKFTHNGCFGFRLKIPRDKLVHVDTSEKVLGGTYDAAWKICASAEAFLDALAARIGTSETGANDVAAAEPMPKLEKAAVNGVLDPVFQLKELTPASDFFAALQNGFPPDSVYVTDSGLHQMLLRRHFIAKYPRQLITPSDFQSMGFGLPAAIGAATAQPSKEVVVIHGDGGFQMVAMDLLTAAEHGLKIRLIVLDDGEYGLIRQQQLGSGLKPGGTAIPALDYAGLAAAIDVPYADASHGLESVFELCEAVQGPVLIRQPISDSDGQTKLYRKMGIRGRIRRSMDPRILGLIRNLKNRL